MHIYCFRLPPIGTAATVWWVEIIIGIARIMWTEELSECMPLPLAV
jgi:hypothetical protein